MTPTQPPASAYVETQGVRYFARMLSKIRLFAAGQLREDFHENLGKGMDDWICDFLGIDYADLRERALKGGSDDEILAWVQSTSGRTLRPIDVRVWNAFISKVGWNDELAKRFAFRKAEAGLQDRAEVKTMIEVFEYDEGRKS
ncbi:DUF5069 domain-containing protein [Synoicihabitans lomoniglobus]|uniref:DUF5069 domain-containing protein n=1 Tax=Synoicihabitans lomoniglobus TaxID=2909285 RepID=A0AAF0CQV1_9BACT|nr:DUF5069 domain-containing protein [Opitutaceae bacterium LMO-M01]WED66321.1 DUF5069 domain-containing protein [Opitutaceae bacterium LMO-M01]